MSSTINKINTVLLEFDELIIKKVSSWGKEGKSFYALSDLSGIRRASLYNIRDGKFTSRNFNPFRLMKLISILDQCELETVKEKYSKFLNVIERVTTQPSESVDEELSTSSLFSKIFSESMSNPVALAIYTHSLGDGVKEKDIMQLYGSYGLTVLEDLKNKGIIHIASTKTKSYQATNSRYVEIEKKHVKNIIKTLSDCYNPNNSGKERNFISFRVDKVNSNTIKKLYQLHSEFHSRTNQVLATEDSGGDIPFYSFSEMDTFIE
jgi:hypothetical protein